MSIRAMLFGANHWMEVEIFAKSKRSFLERILNLANGIPPHNTFGRLFSLIDSEVFGQCFTEWVKSCFEVTNPKCRQHETARKSVRGIGQFELEDVDSIPSKNIHCVPLLNADGSIDEILNLKEYRSIDQLEF